MGCGISVIEAEELRSEQGSNHASNHEHAKDDENARFFGRRSFSSPITKIRIMKAKHDHNNSDALKKVDEEGSFGSKEERRMTGRNDRHIGPGSPSFRDYCVNYDTSSSKTDSDDGDESRQSSVKDAAESSDHQKITSRTKTERKTKRRRIRQAFSRRAGRGE